MKKGFFTSVAFHLIILIAVLIGMPRVKPFEIDPSEAITVDISTISDTTKIKAQTKSPDKPATKPAPKAAEAPDKVKPPEKVAPEKKLAAVEPAKSDPPPPKPEPKPEPPKPDPPPEPKPEPKKVEPPPPDQSALNDLLEADQKAIDDKRKADEEKKKAEEKKKKAEDAKKLADQKKADAEKKKKLAYAAKLNDMLDKLNTEQTDQLQKKDTSGTPEQAQQDVQGQDDAAEATIKNLIQKKFNECWSTAPGARGSGAWVRLSWHLDRDGTVTGQPVVIGGDPTNTQHEANMRSAISAVMACQPYSELPKDKYAIWSDLEWTFKP